MIGKRVRVLMVWKIVLGLDFFVGSCGGFEFWFVFVILFWVGNNFML